MKKLTILIAMLMAMNVWSIEIKVIKEIGIEDTGTWVFYCVDGYQYMNAFRTGTTQMFEDDGLNSSKPIKCSM